MNRAALRTMGRVLALGVWLTVGSIGAQTVTGTLARTLAPSIAELERNGSVVGALAIDASTGETLLASRPDEARIPASVQKVLTAAAATLMDDGTFRIVTSLTAEGPIEEGVLRGAIRLYGEFDPRLTVSEDLPRVLHAVRQAGIREIEGDFIIDTRRFEGPRQARGWPADDPATPWMAGPDALSLDSGTVLLEILRGETPRVRVLPEGSGVRVKSELKWSAGNRRAVAVRQGSGEIDLVIRGETPNRGGERHRAAVPAPALAFGRAAAESLTAAGIAIKGSVRRAAREETFASAKVLWRSERPFGDLYAGILGESDNHAAEMLFCHLGARHGGIGSFASGSQSVAKVLERERVSLEGAAIVDGSGLSRENMISPRAVVQVFLALAARERFDAFAPHLAQGGEAETTLRRRLTDIGARVHAKTGTLRDVTALAGALDHRTGRRIYFAFLMQTRGARGDPRPAQRELQDALVRALDAWKPE